jgi:hypothetical protein
MATLDIRMLDSEKIMARLVSSVTPHLSKPDCLVIRYNNIRQDVHYIVNTLREAKQGGAAACKFLRDEDIALAAQAIELFSRMSGAGAAQRVVFSRRAFAIVELERIEPERKTDQVKCLYVDADAVERAVNWVFFTSITCAVLPTVVFSVIFTLAGVSVIGGLMLR